MIDLSKQSIEASSEDIKKKCLEVKRHFENTLATEQKQGNDDTVLILTRGKIIMAWMEGSVETKVGKVYWKHKPTDCDQKGCQGLYFDHVELKPIKEWPLWFLILVAIRTAPKIFMKGARWLLIGRWKAKQKDKTSPGIFQGIPGIR